MRTLTMAALAAVGMTLASAGQAAAQQVFYPGSYASSYDPYSGSTTTYYYIPAPTTYYQPYFGGYINRGNPARTFGPGAYYSYNPAYRASDRGFFSPYRSDYTSFYSPYRRSWNGYNGW